MNVNTPALPASALAKADLLHLGAHLRQCVQARGPAFAWQCWGERVHAVVAPRMITTLVAATGVIALLSLAP